MDKIRVFAPATIANMGCGFDIMGMAMDDVGDVLTMSIEEGDGLEIINNSGVDLPEDVEQNVMTPAVRALLAEFGQTRMVKIVIERKISPGSGIGSSASSSSAAVYGLNQLLGNPFTEERLVEFAMEGEKLISGGTAHADNVAPAVLGGIVLMRGYDPLDMVRVPVPAQMCCSVAHPAIVVKTSMARGILPKEIPLGVGIKQWGNVGGLVAGLYSGDLSLIGRAMKDIVAEPHRKQFIPGFDELREKVLKAGAYALNISGSGPSVFAISKDMKTADNVGKIMREHFLGQNVHADIYVTKISNIGAKVLNH